MFLVLKQKLSNSKIFNKLLQLFVSQFLVLRPLRHVMIEPTNRCNLSCLFCTQSEARRAKGLLTLEGFKEILAKLPNSVKEVQLHFAGESTLNTDLPEMIKLLADKKIKTILSTNGTLPFENYKKIVGAGLNELIISLDGATKEVYEQYRRGGNFETVIDNVKKISELPSRATRLIIQFIVMRHNEQEIDLIKKKAKEWGADELWLKSASFNIGCSPQLEKEILKNAEAFLPKNQKYSRYVVENGRLINKDRPMSCPWIFRTVILWNGDATVCCVDLEGQAVAGNIFEEKSLAKLWKSRKYNQIRKSILRRELEICQNCSIGDNPVKEVVKYK